MSTTRFAKLMRKRRDDGHVRDRVQVLAPDRLDREMPDAREVEDRLGDDRPASRAARSRPKTVTIGVRPGPQAVLHDHALARDRPLARAVRM